MSATALLAEIAGIQIFATGGLGGVHRQGDKTMDISADLVELGRTRVATISSGCKAFLDVRRTLEYLETQGVGVMTFADGTTIALCFHMPDIDYLQVGLERLIFLHFGLVRVDARAHIQ